MDSSAFLVLTASLLAADPAAPDPAPAAGEVRFAGDEDAAGVPPHYRLAAHSFRAEHRLTRRLPHSGVDVYAVSFPSAVATPHPENNTVHAEFFAPVGVTGRPAVIVLDILDGQGVVSRGEAVWLAAHGVPALAVTLPYYGPRRPAGSRTRLLSPDVPASVANVRQAVLDCRRAAAWLAARPEVDAGRIGVVGTSLGSFIGGLVAAAEPRVTAACLLLGGGGLVDAFYDHPKAGPVLSVLRLVGIGKDELKAAIAPADPITYADRLKGKSLLLIAASRDDVVPPVAMKRLWEATGKPKIVWYDATHVGAAAYAFPAMREVLAHLTGEGR
ncbi:MAG: prolyl oligopeptidase family serine peptidase [Gemmataceae bacterium]